MILQDIAGFIESIVGTLHNIARLLPVSQLVMDSKTAEVT